MNWNYLPPFAFSVFVDYSPTFAVLLPKVVTHIFSIVGDRHFTSKVTDILNEEYQILSVYFNHCPCASYDRHFYQLLL